MVLEESPHSETKLFQRSLARDVPFYISRLRQWNNGAMAGSMTPTLDYTLLRDEVLRKMQSPPALTTPPDGEFFIVTRMAIPELKHTFEVEGSNHRRLVWYRLDGITTGKEPHPAQWLNLADPFPFKIKADRYSYYVDLTRETYSIALQYIAILNGLRPKYVDRTATLCGTKGCMHYATLKRKFRQKRTLLYNRYRYIVMEMPEMPTEGEMPKFYEQSGLTTSLGSLYHRFTIEDAEQYPDLDLPWWWQVITWPVTNAYPAWLLNEVDWFPRQAHVMYSSTGRVNVVPVTEFTYLAAQKFIGELDKVMQTIGRISGRDADALDEDQIVRWGDCNDADKEAYLEVTKDFDVENALTWYEEEGSGRVCTFSKEGTTTPTVNRILKAVHGSNISWRGSLFTKRVADHVPPYEWHVSKKLLKRVGVGLLLFDGHDTVVYCPALHNGRAEEWFYVDSWRQPPLTGEDADEFRELKEAVARKSRGSVTDIQHLPSLRLQYDEGSCSAISLMKAFAVAHMIHVVNQPQWLSLETFFEALTTAAPRLGQSTAHYLELCSAWGINDVATLTLFTRSKLMDNGFKDAEARIVLHAAAGDRGFDDNEEVYRRRCSAVHAVAQGMDERGKKDLNWLEKNACFAKLAHRLLPIHLVKSFAFYGTNADVADVEGYGLGGGGASDGGKGSRGLNS
jgi:hypothetical protein